MLYFDFFLLLQKHLAYNFLFGGWCKQERKANEKRHSFLMRCRDNG